MPALKFFIIPTKNTYEEYSEEIVSKIKDVDNCSADLDTNYNDAMNSRVNKYKKNNKNIITIGLSEVEHNTIMIHFNGVRPKTMELDEFIALLESYDEDDNDEDEDDSSSSSESSQDEDVASMFQKQKSTKNKEEKEKEKEEDEDEDGCTIS
jgi:hypothetical protein